MTADIFEYLRQHAPRCLSGFGAVLKDEIVHDHVRAGAFELSCANCKSSTFSLTILSRHWEEGAERSEIGIAAMCSSCGRRKILFDETKYGYDGEHGHLAFMIGEDVEAPLNKSLSTRVRVEFIYNIEMDELLEIAAEQSKSPREFFDAFQVFVDGLGSEEWINVWGCECA